MRGSRRDLFTTVKSEGGLLPADFLQRLVGGGDGIEGLGPDAYHLTGGEKLNEAASRSWNRLLGAWAAFQMSSKDLKESDAGTGITREKWLLALFQELGYGRLLAAKTFDVEGKSYPISHVWNRTPIHLVGRNVDLDRRSPGVAGAAKTSPHGLLQEFLNRSDGHLWGLLSNGLKLRLLRESKSLTRQAYVEFDLAGMMDGQAYADFALLWLLCHQSRVEAERPVECWLEQWAEAARREGTRALDTLRDAVQKAIESLGRGFLGHPANAALIEKLRVGPLTTQDYYRQLLRIIYRLIFLFVAEDRDLLLVAPPGSKERDRYLRYYSMDRIRTLAERRRGTPHSDLWQGCQLVCQWLGSDSGCQELGLPALGSYLWSAEATPDLDDCVLANAAFLEAVRTLAFTVDAGIRRAIDYRNLGPEELGSVYESLLELHSDVNLDATTFTLRVAAGHERKTSGSYYTPDSLVQCLLDSALEPVMDEAVKGRSGEDAAKALLALKICDPAVGSGHFLIAAAHRIANHLAAVRTGDEEPSPEAVRKAMRDVIGHCLYGVDVNPMAAELCRVSLWLEALEPGKPLSFLDHHIRVGNSLLGTTPELIAAGLPDEAFTAIEGDDKKACSELKKRNRKEGKGQRDMLHLMVREPEVEYNTLAARTRIIDEAPDNTIDEIERKAEQFQELIVSPDYRHAQQVADTWCAVFVWRKQANPPIDPITTDTVRRLQADPIALTPAQHREVERLSNQYQFFHWHLAFPEVFARGGFDCVLGNPPWERVKLQEQEWFAQRRPEIAEAPNTAARKLLIETLLTEEPELHARFMNALRNSAGESHFLRNSQLYPLCGHGDINLFAVFAEAMRKRRSDVGSVGAVVPTALVTDITTQEFFRTILDQQELASVLDFSNEKGLFPSVRGHQQFALLTLRGGSNPVRRPVFGFYFSEVSELQDQGRVFSLSPSNVHLVNPNTFTAPVFRTSTDACLMRRLYLQMPVLIREAQDGRPEENPWGIRFTRMFDMANDSHLFRTREQLEAQGWRLEGNVFRKDNAERLPLFDAKMAQQYNHRAAELGHSGHKFRKISKEQSSPEELSDSTFSPSPLYYIPNQELLARTAGWRHRWFLGFKDITGTTSVRLAAFAVIPWCGVGHPFPVVLGDGSALDHAMLLAVLNGLPIEYVLRQKLQGLHLTYYYLKQVPVPVPAAFGKQCHWGATLQTSTEWLFRRVLELTYTAWDLEPFAEDCGWDGPPFRWNEDRRFLLRCELDAAFFHLYLLASPDGQWKPARIAEDAIRDETPEELAELKRYFPTPRDAVSYIMDTFPIVRRKDEEKWGEYRSKCLILEIYDAMAEAIRTGHPYQTRLDPPPADPSMAHAMPRDES